jgi:Zn-dependent protease with chaperone function
VVDDPAPNAFSIGRNPSRAGICLIPAAFFREREFLADADSVLLTRFPEGLIQAFVKTTNHPTKLKHGEGQLSSILFVPSGAVSINSRIADGTDFMIMKRWFPKGILETHPSVEERIQRIKEIQAPTGGSPHS